MTLSTTALAQLCVKQIGKPADVTFTVTASDGSVFENVDAELLVRDILDALLHKAAP